MNGIIRRTLYGLRGCQIAVLLQHQRICQAVYGVCWRLGCCQRAHQRIARVKPKQISHNVRVQPAACRHAPRLEGLHHLRRQPHCTKLARVNAPGSQRRRIWHLVACAHLVPAVVIRDRVMWLAAQLTQKRLFQITLVKPPVLIQSQITTLCQCLAHGIDRQPVCFAQHRLAKYRRLHPLFRVNTPCCRHLIAVQPTQLGNSHQKRIPAFVQSNRCFACICRCNPVFFRDTAGQKLPRPVYGLLHYFAASLHPHFCTRRARLFLQALKFAAAGIAQPFHVTQAARAQLLNGLCCRLYTKRLVVGKLLRRHTGFLCTIKHRHHAAALLGQCNLLAARQHAVKHPAHLVAQLHIQIAQFAVYPHQPRAETAE